MSLSSRTAGFSISTKLNLVLALSVLVVLGGAGAYLSYWLGQKSEARSMAEASYAPKLPPRNIKVAGRGGIANCEMLLLNMKEGGMISAHDYRVAKYAAIALCGGDVESGSLVDEEWLLSVERQLFVDLLKNEKTLQRIEHTLETGKPLRN